MSQLVARTLKNTLTNATCPLDPGMGDGGLRTLSSAMMVVLTSTRRNCSNRGVAQVSNARYHRRRCLYSHCNNPRRLAGITTCKTLDEAIRTDHVSCDKSPFHQLSKHSHTLSQNHPNHIYHPRLRHPQLSPTVLLLCRAIHSPMARSLRSHLPVQLLHAVAQAPDSRRPSIPRSLLSQSRDEARLSGPSHQAHCRRFQSSGVTRANRLLVQKRYQKPKEPKPAPPGGSLRWFDVCTIDHWESRRH